MNKEELFFGFSEEQQAEYKREIIERFGEQGRASIEESKRKAYEAYHAQLPEFVCEAIQVFAEKEL